VVVYVLQYGSDTEVLSVLCGGAKVIFF